MQPTLLGLGDGLEGGAKDVVPELAGDAKPELVVKVVVSQMVLLELLIPQREVLVVEEVVRQVIADIAEDTATVSSNRSVPMPEDEGMGHLPEWGCENDEERRRHD